jgi:hypothetical protein
MYRCEHVLYKLFEMCMLLCTAAAVAAVATAALSSYLLIYRWGHLLYKLFEMCMLLCTAAAATSSCSLIYR